MISDSNPGSDPAQWRLTSLQRSDRDAVVSLIAAAMDEDEARWAAQTLDFHFHCTEQGIDSMRRMYAARGAERETLLGIVGLHQYRWGPEQNVWLSWFAVHPNQQGQGIGKWMLASTQTQARELGYRKMFIETYRHPLFERALEFYRRQGYREAGQVQGYLADGSAMLILSKILS